MNRPNFRLAGALVGPAAVAFGFVVWTAASAGCGGDTGHPNSLGDMTNEGGTVDASTMDAGGMDANKGDSTTDAPIDTGGGPDTGCVDGAGGGGAVMLSASSLAFGMVNCGAQASAQPFTITNGTCGMVSYNASLTTGSGYYTVSPDMGQINPGASQIVQVIPNPIPASSQVDPNPYDGVLNITTTAPGDTAHIVQLSMAAQGVILTESAPAPMISFNTPLGTTGMVQYSITNTGNIPATLTLAVGTPSYTVSPTSITVPANGQPVEVNVTFTPTAVTNYPDTVFETLASGTAQCGTPLDNVTLTGSGTDAIGVDPSNLNFGNVKCGAPAAAPQTFTITNNGAATTYTLSLGKMANSPYALALVTDAGTSTIAMGESEPLGAASSATIEVIPLQVVAPASTGNNSYGDTLTIATTSLGDTPHTVSLLEQPQGAALTVTPTSVMATGPDGEKQFVAFTVTNNGNMNVGFSIVTEPTPTFSANVDGGALNGGAATNGNELTIQDPLSPMSQITGSLNVTPNSGSVLCADPPPPVPLSIISN